MQSSTRSITTANGKRRRVQDSDVPPKVESKHSSHLESKEQSQENPIGVILDPKRCQAITQKGHQCSRKPSTKQGASSQHCTQHGWSLAVTTFTKSHLFQCSGITKKGERCKLNLKKAGFCKKHQSRTEGMHQDQADTESVEY